MVNVSVVARTPQFSNDTMRVLFSDWQIAPLVRWQSGNWTSVTTGVDNAFTGLGGQRAVQILDDPYAARTPDNYLNRNAFTSPDPGTYSTLRPNTIKNPSQWVNDLAVISNLQDRRQLAAVPLGNLQRRESCELQRASRGAQQLELRPDSDRRAAADHAVCAEVRFLMSKASRNQTGRGPRITRITRIRLKRDADHADR